VSWKVYLLECADNTLYCGITNDIPKRLKTHNQGKGAKYTRVRLPVKLVYQHSTETKSEALKLEIKIKKMKRAEKLKLLSEEPHPQFHSQLVRLED
jgi:putative endonuclease